AGLEPERSVLVALDQGPGEVARELLRHGDRAGARPSPAVRRGERLVRVDVHDVEAHVARTAAAKDRVQVRPVVVDETADAVDGGRDLLDLLLEQPERVR